MERLHLIVSGRVQGVFFRAHTRKEALRLGLTGYVKNRDDGMVEIIAEGPKEKLEKLVAFCRKGSPSADVENVEVRKEPFRNEFSHFEIRY